MSTKKKKPTPKKVWHPLERNPQWWVDQQAERVFADIQNRYPDIPKEAIEEQFEIDNNGTVWLSLSKCLLLKQHFPHMYSTIEEDFNCKNI